jgi:single-strand DNA-binding protein
LSGSVNRVILVGRLGKDPEIKYTASGMAMAKFSVATDEVRKDQQGNRQTNTEWHNIVFWGKQAEIAGEYLKKGTLIYIEGRLRTRSWDDPSGGGKRYATEVQGDRFQMLSSRGDGGESQEGPRGSGTYQTQPEGPQETAEDEDLPF